jgi:hypothetical protein
MPLLNAGLEPVVAPPALAPANVREFIKGNPRQLTAENPAVPPGLALSERVRNSEHEQNLPLSFGQ